MVSTYLQIILVHSECMSAAAQPLVQPNKSSVNLATPGPFCCHCCCCCFCFPSWKFLPSQMGKHFRWGQKRALSSFCFKIVLLFRIFSWEDSLEKHVLDRDTAGVEPGILSLEVPSLGWGQIGRQQYSSSVILGSCNCSLIWVASGQLEAMENWPPLSLALSHCWVACLSVHLHRFWPVICRFRELPSSMRNLQHLLAGPKPDLWEKQSWKWLQCHCCGNTVSSSIKTGV